MPDKTKLSISGSTLKWIAIISMFIDHLAASFLSQYMTLPGTPDYYRQIYRIMRDIGRLAFPIYIFLLIEGLAHTRNVRRYLLRLFLFALISEIPFDLAFHYTFFYPDYQNVFFTLLIGLFTIWMMQLLEERWSQAKWLPFASVLCIFMLSFAASYTLHQIIVSYSPNLCFGSPFLGFFPLFYITFALLLVFFVILYLVNCKTLSTRYINHIYTMILFTILGMFAATILKTDYSFVGVLAIVVMYLLRKNKFNQFIYGCCVLALSSITEFFALFALIPVSLYNGTRGRQMKYFFYIFYPAHLFLLWVLFQLVVVPRL